jgi:hypothetical protein
MTRIVILGDFHPQAPASAFVVGGLSRHNILYQAEIATIMKYRQFLCSSASDAVGVIHFLDCQSSQPRFLNSYKVGPNCGVSMGR